MILRFRSKDGMFRITVDPAQDFKQVIPQLSEVIKGVNIIDALVSTKPNGQDGEALKNLCGKSPQQLNLKHGDMLFLKYESAIPVDQNVIPIDQNAKDVTPKQFEIDDVLDAKEGLITRSKTSFCRHTDQGMCEYCSPLPPWDKDYLVEKKIKHKSFHAYLKELNQNINKSNGSSYIPPLKEPNYSVNKNCNGGHKPWPEGICSKCQPSAITLQPQEFRMVDHVEFADSQIINTFIDSWRSSGTQRIGFMYGKYEEYPMVPLGIKGVVEAIYEIPQVGLNDGLTMLDWENEAKIDEVAQLCGLSKIGIIFTDLTDSGNGDGSVVCKRHKNSYFLSSLEILFAARHQIKYPNYSKHAISGKFSSKFVTCVISGNLSQEIEISSYQVSASAEALVKADLICGSTHPAEVYVNEKTNQRYVPDIFYKFKNQYGVVVQQNAKPAFPNDYLLVTLTHGFPQDPQPIFVSSSQFPVENRQYLGISQDLVEINKYLQLNKIDTNNYESVKEFMNSVSDFHFLCYLFSLNILSDDDCKLLAKVATSHDDINSCYSLFESPTWRTFLTIAQSS